VLIQAAIVSQYPAPSVLTEARGREFMYLLEVMKDELPSGLVQLFYGRDKGELVIEQQALDLGVSADRLIELEDLIDELSSQDDLDSAMDALSDCTPHEAEFVVRHLRWDTTSRDHLLGWVTESHSAYTDLSAELKDMDQVGALTGGDYDNELQLREAVGSTGLGGYALDGEGTDDRYSGGDAAFDMARGLPGATLNVMYGMARSVPIAGDAMDWAVGDHVDAGIGALNQDWMGLDKESSDTQQTWGQTAGLIAGSIGLAGIAGPNAATASVAGKSAQVPAWAARSLWGADLAYGTYQAGVGENLKGEELEPWQRALAAVGLTLSGVAGASQIVKNNPGSTAAIDDLTKLRQAEEATVRLRPELDLVSEVNAANTAAAEAKAISEFRAVHEADWGQLADWVTKMGIGTSGTRSTLEAQDVVTSLWEMMARKDVQEE
jgi:hypothetical protein